MPCAKHCLALSLPRTKALRNGVSSTDEISEIKSSYHEIHEVFWKVGNENDSTTQHSWQQKSVTSTEWIQMDPVYRLQISWKKKVCRFHPEPELLGFPWSSCYSEVSNKRVHMYGSALSLRNETSHVRKYKLQTKHPATVSAQDILGIWTAPISQTLTFKLPRFERLNVYKNHSKPMSDSTLC